MVSAVEKQLVKATFVSHRVGYAFGFFDLKNTQIGLPLVVTKQWIVVLAQ